MIHGSIGAKLAKLAQLLVPLQWLVFYILHIPQITCGLSNECVLQLCVTGCPVIGWWTCSFFCWLICNYTFLCCLIEGLYFESIMGNVSCNYALRVALLLGDELVIFLLAYLQIYISGLLDWGIVFWKRCELMHNSVTHLHEVCCWEYAQQCTDLLVCFYAMILSVMLQSISALAECSALFEECSSLLYVLLWLF